MKDALDFEVRGTPVAQGSMVASKNRVWASNASALAAWREAVLLAGQRAWGEDPARHSAFTLSIDFYFSRPATHYGTGRNAGRLKASAPVFITKRPDLDKLVRSVLDALTGVIWHDDAQVVSITTAKDYGAIDRCHIRLRRV